MQFLKKNEVQLINGGYLSNLDEKPVFHYSFVNAQLLAEKLHLVSEKVKGKTFSHGKISCFSDILKEVESSIYDDKKVEFISAPTAPKQDLLEKMKKEALSWDNFQDELLKTKEINEYMQNFKIVKEFEDFGLFFENHIVKLNRIYTVEEILGFVTSLKPFLSELKDIQ